MELSRGVRRSAGIRLARALRLCGALAFAACIVLAPICGAHAQPADPPRRPKVALVLSGGGAMGIAHVGAILELERAGIRPDLIVGTSMGSIVGGLYASGMSGAELKQAVEAMNWDAIFDASPPRSGLTFRQKQQESDFPVKASVGVVGTRLRTPEALVSDANLLLQLRRLLGGREAVSTFDDLPIPFRAVATDIETGDKVVLDRGELAGAMRASMSVPGVFAPYRWAGKSLVDGGMADNVPIDVARDLGADIVIVVATQTPLAKGEDVRSAPQVLGQTVTLLILANERRQLATVKATDVLINVDTKGLGSADFKKGAALIAAGRQAALAQEPELRRVAALRGPTQAVSVTRPPPVIDYVKIENSSRISDEILLRDVEPFVGHPLDTDAVVAAMQRIYAIGVFTRVDFRIEQGDGRTGLVVAAIQRPGDVNRLRPGITIAAMGKGHSEFDVSLEYRMLQLDAYGSDARFVGVLGDRKQFTAEYFKVLDSRQGWFVVPGLDVQRRPVPVYDSKGFRLGEYDVRYGLVSLAAGRQFDGVGEIRLGLERGTGKASLQEGDVTPRDVDLDVGQVFALAGADTLDNAYFPTQGGKALLEWTHGLRSLGDVADFQKVDAAGLYTLGWGRNALIVSLAGGDTVQGRLPLSSLFSLGGPFSFPGYSVDELTGETFAVARAFYRRKLTGRSENLFSIPLYAGFTVVAGNTWARPDDVDFSNLRVGGSLYIAADTLIGPVFLSVAAADRGRSAFYVFVGRPF